MSPHKEMGNTQMILDLEYKLHCATITHELGLTFKYIYLNIVKDKPTTYWHVHQAK